MAYQGFSGAGYVGNFSTAAALQIQYPANLHAGREATIELIAGQVTQYLSDGLTWKPIVNFTTDLANNITGLMGLGTEIIVPLKAGLIETTVTVSGTLPETALGRITPVNSAGATTQTLPAATAAFALKPYGIVVLSQKGAGVPSFAVNGGDVLRATAGIGPCVQYGMCAAQVISATEWALA